MRTSDFHFSLPPERIAARAVEPRDSARLLLLDRRSGARKHTAFHQLGRFLPARALVVLNDTAVIPARLRGRKPSGGMVEILLTRRVSDPAEERGGGGATGEGGEEEWEALGRNLGGVAAGAVVDLGSELEAEVIGRGERGAIRVRLRTRAGRSVMQLVERLGEVPLPPYVEAARRRAEAAAAAPPGGQDDRLRYQTVYAAAPGAVAAPTAGLHFTSVLLSALAGAGHDLAFLTLHVGLGTFRPVEAAEVEAHRMEPEPYIISPATAAAVEAARAAGRPVVAVGTTTVRALETAARAGSGTVRAGAGSTDLFLVPGDRFQVVTDLVTNFHLPGSTLVMLVSAFAGRSAVLDAYAEAIALGYRFGSYGDAMLIRGTGEAPR